MLDRAQGRTEKQVEDPALLFYFPSPNSSMPEFLPQVARIHQRDSEHGNPERASSADFIRAEEQYGAHNYHPLDEVIQRAEGVWVWDVEVNKYLDFLAAYSAVNQGHAHPRIAGTLREPPQGAKPGPDRPEVVISNDMGGSWTTRDDSKLG